MQKTLRLKPYLEPKIWGSNHLSEFNIDLNNQSNIGEAWIISGYKGKSSTITNGKFKNQTLNTIYKNYPQLFNFYKSESYPLLVKILDCNDNLSVQVHPNDDYALKHYQSLGKNECWYILSATDDANIILGHTAKTKSELNNLVKKQRWSDLLIYEHVKKDDFYYVPAMTVHAINKGLVIYELQQTSDLTFRLFDYNRLVDNKPRELNIKEALANIKVPYIKQKLFINIDKNQYLIDNKYFSLVKIINTKTNKYGFKSAPWLQVSVIEGKGFVNLHRVKKGANLIILKTNLLKIKGQVTVLVSFVK